MKPAVFAVAALVAALTLANDANASMVLPHGSRVTPQGSLTPLATLPLRVLPDSTGKWLAIIHGGFGPHGVMIANAQSGKVVDRVIMDSAYSALAFSKDGKRIYVGTNDGLAYFAFDPATGKLGAVHLLSFPMGGVTTVTPLEGGDILLSFAKTDSATAGGRAYAIGRLKADESSLRWSAPLTTLPFAIVANRAASTAYVSNWLTNSVSAIDLQDGHVVETIATAAHPTAMVFSNDERRLFVACAASNDVAAIDTSSNAVAETIDVGLYPNAIMGSTPNGLALSPDGRTLYVANADDNAVMKIDVASQPATVRGAIPVGWYPTDVAISSDGDELYVLDGKGLGQVPNDRYVPYFPKGLTPSQLAVLAEPNSRRALDYAGIPQFYVGNIEIGQLERIHLAAVDAGSGMQQARANSLYHPAASSPSAQWLPPVHHVIYIIKENRTYDQVLGDDARGNGDPKLAMFGKRITPNIHRIVDQFVLADNYYLEGEVSENGWPFAESAYASDVIQRDWPASYGSQATPPFPRSAFEPPGGYIWDKAKQAGVSERHDWNAEVQVSGALGTMLSPPDSSEDQQTVDTFLAAFKTYEANDSLPALELMGLGGDHTAGTEPFQLTPNSFVASNDYALARLIDAVSHSKYWRDTVIFVTEDDAQNGPDHVSAQRSYLLVAGAYVKRGFVDHTHYSQTGILHTIEQLLGISPMTQYDASATSFAPMFLHTPDMTPFNAQAPLVSLTDRNPPSAIDAKVSARLRFDLPDENDPAILNKILWDYAVANGSIAANTPVPSTTAMATSFNDDPGWDRSLHFIEAKAGERGYTDADGRD